ncbi:UDP-N-acetylmuramoylalanine--D-glutamate ligase [Synergistales bacterium]|nr:UDP-N-acetylmuramoylalanine--D-glutamate ligase [Synergistales bacterium]
MSVKNTAGGTYPGVKITVLGGGLSGKSLALLAARLSADVFLSDAAALPNETLAELERDGVSFEVGGHTDRALCCNFAVVSSGFPPKAEIIGKFKDRGIKIVGELDFVSPFLNGRLIGITGSNGKTTTTSLLGHLLKSAGGGDRVAVVGNIGSAIADAAGQDYDYIVAELSSFQLHRAEKIKLDIAILTNLAPDHIDWHGSYKNYAADKMKIIKFVKEGGRAIVRKNELDELGGGASGAVILGWDEGRAPNKIVLSSDERRVYLSDETLFDFGDTSMIGAHNMENAGMAVAAAHMLGFGTYDFRRALSSFTPPPHRCALVASSGGVRYVDDSKGTNVAATITALSSIEGRKIIILGGRGKGEDYGRLAEPLKKFSKRAILIGEAADEIAVYLTKNEYPDFSRASSMEEAVSLASGIAEGGDVVLLSPACTSWDMYKNYGERGEHFASCVKKIIAGEDVT